MRDRVVQFINRYKYVYLPKSGNIVAVVDRSELPGIIDASDDTGLSEFLLTNRVYQDISFKS